MENFVYRNYTVEHLFDSSTDFSGYGDVTVPDHKYQNIILFYQLNPSKTPEDQIKEIAEIKSKISLLTNLTSDVRIIIMTLLENFKNNWQMKNAELSTQITLFNNVFLKQLSTDKINVKILDLNRFFGSQQYDVVDWKFFFTSQIIINPRLAKSFKKWFASQLKFISLQRKKCIILDCDNTLWGGIVGEDGPLGVMLGQDYPGNAYKGFQELLLMLSKKGIILAACSKNNFADVQELWRNNTYNLINDKVLSAYRINWQNKVENIKSIAEELNIGIESCVFIDDNPIERGLVKEFLPEVATPEFPNKPYELIDFFWNVYNEYFLAWELSNEDLNKTSQYKENFLRNESKKIFTNMDDYLASLDIEVDIMPLTESNISRIAQMTQKTNQFNLRTQRYTEDDLRQKRNSGSHIFCANVKDKFGDNGITIGCIVDEKDYLFIDSYFLSCRILGREIEKITLLTILNYLILKTGKIVKAEFLPTDKNNMAKDFLEQTGFRVVLEKEDGTKEYIFDPEKKVSIKDYYKIKFS